MQATTHAPTRRRRSERSRRAILDGAAKLLSKRGYADITIEGIAEQAGVGKTTIYRWWPTKASIYVELYNELSTKIAPPADSGNVVTDLGWVIKGAFKLYRETAAGLALAGIVAEAQLNATVSRMVRNEFAPTRRQIVVTILQRAVKRKEIADDVDIELVSEVLAGAVWYCLLVGSAPLTDEHANRLINTIVGGIYRKNVKIRARKSFHLNGPRKRS